MSIEKITYTFTRILPTGGSSDLLFDDNKNCGFERIIETGEWLKQPKIGDIITYEVESKYKEASDVKRVWINGELVYDKNN